MKRHSTWQAIGIQILFHTIRLRCIKNLPAPRVYVIDFLINNCFSLAIELSRAHFTNRFASFMDVFNNSPEAALGGYIFKYVLPIFHKVKIHDMLRSLISPLPSALKVRVYVWIVAEQLAVLPPLAPLQVQLQGWPLPLTAEGVPPFVTRRFEGTVAASVRPLSAPHAPFTGVAQTLVVDALLRGLGAPAMKSALLLSVSVQPLPARRSAVVLLGAGAGPPRQ